MTQYARPDSDVTRTNVASGTYADIDESSPSDSDYLYGTNNTAVTYECGLSDITDPESALSHTFKYRVAKTKTGVVDGGGSVTVVTAYLIQGTTVIATDTQRTLDGNWTTYTLTISESEANAITNYADLRLRFVSPASGGTTANRRSVGLSWAEVEVPDAVASITGSLDKGLDGVSISAAGELPVSGLLDKSLDAVSISSAGGPSLSGVLSKNLDDVSIAASGTAGNEACEGSLSKVLDDCGISAAGSVSVSGVLVEDLGSVGISAYGILAIDGSLAKNLDNAGLSSAGETSISGELAEDLASVTISANGSIGDVPVEGVLSQAVNDVGISAVGSVFISGFVSCALDDAVCSGDGSVDVSGALDGGLDDCQLVASGEIADNTVYGVAELSLEEIGVLFQGSVVISGYTEIELDGMIVDASGKVGTVAAVRLSLPGRDLYVGLPERGIVLDLPERYNEIYLPSRRRRI
jgi:hypothetical protein